MDTTIKARGMELTAGLREAVEHQLIEPIDALSQAPAAAIDVELASGPPHEGAHRFACRVHLTVPHEGEVVIHEHDDDLYKAIALAHDRLLLAARKQKAKHNDVHQLQREAAKHRAQIARDGLTLQSSGHAIEPEWQKETAAYERDQRRQMHLP